MLTMPEINSIKCLRNDKSLSINEIADIHKINWRTAKKYADDEQIPVEKVKKKKGNYDEQTRRCLKVYRRWDFRELIELYVISCKSGEKAAVIQRVRSTIRITKDLPIHRQKHSLTSAGGGGERREIY